jgi:hypothetical protein
MTISDGVGVFAAGSSQADDGEGVAIRNEGTLTISNSILSGNSAPAGGAINNDGTLTVNGCTLTGSSAPGGNGQGGAIANYGTLTLSQYAVPQLGLVWWRHRQLRHGHRQLRHHPVLQLRHAGWRHV